LKNETPQNSTIFNKLIALRFQSFQFPQETCIRRAWSENDVKKFYYETDLHQTYQLFTTSDRL